MSQRTYLRNGEKERLWRDVLTRQAKAELTVREFCRREGLQESSFYFWKRTIAERDRESKTTTTKRRKRAKPTKRTSVKRRRKSSGTSSRSVPTGRRGTFLPVTVTREPFAPEPCLEVISPEDWRVRVPSGVDPKSLAQVLDALQSAGRETGQC